MTSNRTGAGTPLWLGGVLALLVSVHVSWANLDGTRGLDFFHYWVVPNALRAGLTDIYSPQGRQALKQFADRQEPAGDSSRFKACRAYWSEPQPTGTPLQYALIGLAISPDYEASYVRFQALSLFLAMAGLVALGTSLAVRLPVALVGAASASAFLPFVSDGATGNVGRLLVFFLCTYCSLRVLAFRMPQRPQFSVASGFVLGLAILFKPILIAAPATLMMNRWVLGRPGDMRRELLGIAIAALFAASFVWIAFGTATPWIDWAANVGPMLSESAAQSDANLALRRMLTDQFGAVGSWVCVAAASAVLLAQFVLLRALGAARKLDEAVLSRVDLAAIAVSFALFLLLSKLVWLHYYTLAVPAILWTLAESWRRRSLLLVTAGASTAILLQMDAGLNAALILSPFALCLGALLLIAGERSGR